MRHRKERRATFCAVRPAVVMASKRPRLCTPESNDDLRHRHNDELPCTVDISLKAGQQFERTEPLLPRLFPIPPPAYSSPDSATAVTPLIFPHLLTLPHAAGRLTHPAESTALRAVPYRVGMHGRQERHHPSFFGRLDDGM